MKKFHTHLLTAIAVSVLGTTAFADGPFDRFIPRGRLLKKLRDDLVGAPDQKQPTPAKRPSTANQKGPTPAVRSHAQPDQRTAPQRSSQRSDKNAAKSPTYVRSGSDGFGMVVAVDKKDNVVVTQVAPGGNAAEAGLQRGDLIVEAGGVELTSIEAFQEISKMLGAGDQLDLQVHRRGRKNTVTLQHGQPPQLKDTEVSKGLSLADASPNEPQSLSLDDEFSFVPAADEDSRPGMRSVIEASMVPARPVSTQQRALGQLQSNSRPVQPQQSQQAATQQQIRILERQLDQLRRQQGVTGSGVRASRRGR